jgi:segregation and condensation protein A
MSFRVQLDAFRGPLDLLVFLARQDEIDLGEVEVAAIVRQYLDYLPTPENTADAVANLSEVGDFLEAASTLLEMKARLVLPSEEDGDEPQVDDPHDELVQRLLDYKRYKDAAVVLEEHGAAWRERYSRAADDFPARRSDPADQPLHEIELWDLVSALGRVLRDNQPARAANIIYDDTPLSVHMRRVTELVGRQGGASFSELFQAGMHKSTMIGLFLAVLELVRNKRVRAEQEGLHTEIRILPDEQFAAAWEEDAATS